MRGHNMADKPTIENKNEEITQDGNNKPEQKESGSLAKKLKDHLGVLSVIISIVIALVTGFIKVYIYFDNQFDKLEKQLSEMEILNNTLDIKFHVQLYTNYLFDIDQEISDLMNMNPKTTKIDRDIKRKIQKRKSYELKLKHYLEKSNNMKTTFDTISFQQLDIQKRNLNLRSKNNFQKTLGGKHVVK
jgi:hypothetical protein